MPHEIALHLVGIFLRGMAAVLIWGCAHSNGVPSKPLKCWSEPLWETYYHGVPVSNFPMGWEARFFAAKPLVFSEGKTDFFRNPATKLQFACQWQMSPKNFKPGETENGPVKLRAVTLESWSRGNSQSRWFVKIRMQGEFSERSWRAQTPSFFLYCRAEKESLAQNFHIADVLLALKHEMTSGGGSVCVLEDKGYRNPIY